MRLLIKFSLLLILVLGAGLSVAAYLSHQFLQRNAREQVIQQARIMMETTLSIRDYTSKQLKPLLITHQMHVAQFLPQSVPAYSASEMFKYLRAAYPAYTYKEASLNPTNLRARAVDWENDIINAFRNFPDKKEVIGERDTPEGRALYLARPIKVSPACLECHSVPQKAPIAMIRTYGRNNGFGWKEGEVIAAQIVSVPMAVPVEIADKAFRNLVLFLAVVGVAVLVIVNIGLSLIVIRPVTQMSQMADEISKGNLNVAELPVSGGDEISTLGKSFNRMYVSLAKAIRLLENES
ncbi:MAG: DUF3365 domain-containing protein [Acidobacteria bacterium]|nr:DUF3365 domain-containing protein [Acidobacteriota bacterium]